MSKATTTLELPELACNFGDVPVVNEGESVYVSPSRDVLPPPRIGRIELSKFLLGKTALWLTDDLAAIIDSMTGRAKINEDTGCWELPTYDDDRNRARYGLIHSNRFGNLNLAHRITLTYLTNRLNPKTDLFVDHLCQNKPCCNPRHLEAVTAAENNRRGRRTAEARSHEPLPMIELATPQPGMTLREVKQRFPNHLEKWPWINS